VITTENTRARIMLAAIARCEDVGLRRTTMEDVARAAGLGRATLYRHFASKEALVRTIIALEVDQFFEALDDAITSCVGPEERLAEGFAFALDYVRGHAMLNRLLRTEPETLLPYLIGDGRLIELATAAVIARIDAEPGSRSIDAEDERVSAELAVRLVLSLALSPTSAVASSDRESARRLARRHLVPTCAQPARAKS
jgi:AcrR family transcriptional regulator